MLLSCVALTAVHLSNLIERFSIFHFCAICVDIRIPTSNTGQDTGEISSMAQGLSRKSRSFWSPAERLDRVKSTLPSLEYTLVMSQGTFEGRGLSWMVMWRATMQTMHLNSGSFSEPSHVEKLPRSHWQVRLAARTLGDPRN